MSIYDTSGMKRETPNSGSTSVDDTPLVTLQTELDERVGRITALEMELHNWKEIFDAVADPICVVRADFHVERANAAYMALFGDAGQTSPQYQCFAMDPRGTAPCVGCPLPETVLTGRPRFVQQELMVSMPHSMEPERRIFQRWTYPIINSDGAVERVVEVLKDITEQERLRRSISLAEGAREADRLKSELLGTVSHELRTPLATIKGYAATLLRHDRRLPRAERLEYLQAIVGASNRLEALIIQLLELSQLETGSITLHRFPEDILRLAREAITQVERQATGQEQMSESDPGDRSLAFALRVEGEATERALPLVRIDARLIREVLDNLLDNAVKYSHASGVVEVILRLVTRVPGEVPSLVSSNATGETSGSPAIRWLDIAVHDTGVGIPSDQLGRIFERFHRVDTRLTRNVNGMGLGLAISKRIVELHGGSIWVESEPGAGSTFHVLLPVSESDDLSM